MSDGTALDAMRKVVGSLALNITNAGLVAL
jgi:hypothetical protein